MRGGFNAGEIDGDGDGGREGMVWYIVKTKMKPLRPLWVEEFEMGAWTRHNDGGDISPLINGQLDTDLAWEVGQ